MGERSWMRGARERQGLSYDEVAMKATRMLSEKDKHMGYCIRSQQVKELEQSEETYTHPDFAKVIGKALELTPKEYKQLGKTVVLRDVTPEGNAAREYTRRQNKKDAAREREEKKKREGWQADANNRPKAAPQGRKLGPKARLNGGAVMQRIGDLGLSCRELERRCGLGQNYISRLVACAKRGDRCYTTTIERMAQVLAMKPEELTVEEGLDD